jgi:hypothetical protein
MARVGSNNLVISGGVTGSVPLVDGTYAAGALLVQSDTGEWAPAAVDGTKRVAILLEDVDTSVAQKNAAPVMYTGVFNLNAVDLGPNGLTAIENYLHQYGIFIKDSRAE